MIKAFQLQQETAAHHVHSEHIKQSSLQLCSDMLSDMRGLEKSVNKIMNVLTLWATAYVMRRPLANVCKAT